jgi:hypothetical protein
MDFTMHHAMQHIVCVDSHVRVWTCNRHLTEVHGPLAPILPAGLILTTVAILLALTGIVTLLHIGAVLG